jgi:hypothetical protein
MKWNITSINTICTNQAYNLNGQITAGKIVGKGAMNVRIGLPVL